MRLKIAVSVVRFRPWAPSFQALSALPYNPWHRSGIGSGRSSALLGACPNDYLRPAIRGDGRVSLLSEIQQSLLADGSDLGRTLLKIKFLASRIGSHVLEDWVGHEISGYPAGTPVPEYRTTSLIYHATVSNIAYIRQNAPVPIAMIAKLAGKSWLTHDLRDGIAVIEDRIARSDDNAKYSIDASNLLLLIQDKIFEDQTIIDINGVFDIRAFVSVVNAVRAKLLDLTIRLEKDVPGIMEITVTEKLNALPPEAAAAANTATQSVVYNVNGPFTQITNSGQAGGITVNVAQGNIESLIRDLVAHGVPDADAKELAAIIQDEKPESAKEPFGKRARAWIAGAAGKAWNTASPILTSVMTEAAKKYYGLT
jgi:hypothetical protein